MEKNKHRGAVGNWVAIAIAEDQEHARDCQRMLVEREIDATIKPTEDPNHTGGVEILVPEEFVDAAQAILTARNSPEDFWDFSLDYTLRDDEDEE
jgi:hypothetical protein